MATNIFNGNDYNPKGVEEGKKEIIDNSKEISEDKKKKVEGVAATGAGLGLVAGAGNIMSALDQQELQLDDDELEAIMQNAIDEVLNDDNGEEEAEAATTQTDKKEKDSPAKQTDDQVNKLEEGQEEEIEDIGDTIQEEYKDDDSHPEETSEEVEMVDINIDEIQPITDLNTDFDDSIAQQLVTDNEELKLFEQAEQDAQDEIVAEDEEMSENFDELNVIEEGLEGDALDINQSETLRDTADAPHFDIADANINEEEVRQETPMPDFDFAEIDTSEKIAHSTLRVDGMTTITDTNGNEIVAARMIDSEGNPFLIADVDGDGFFNELIAEDGHVIDTDFPYNLTAGDLQALNDNTGGYINLDGISEHVNELDAISQFVDTDGSLVAEDLSGDDISDEDLFAQIYDQNDEDSLENVYDNDDVAFLDDELANIDIDDNIDTVMLDEDEV